MIEKARGQISIQQIKDYFPQYTASDDLCYLDSAATTLKPLPMIEAVSDFYTYGNATVHRSIYPIAQSATERFENVRCQMAKLFCCSRDQIIFTKGTTDAMNLLAHTLGQSVAQANQARPGDNEKRSVFLERSAHHANFVPWQLVAKNFPLEINFCKREDFEISSLPLNDQTLAISFSHVSNVTGLGSDQDWSPLTSMAKKYGVYTLVDGAQGITSLMALGESERKAFLCDIDAYAFSTHKIYGPTGLGVLYLSRELLERLGPYQGGGEMIERVDIGETTFSPAPLLFEAGTPPIASVIGFGATLDFLSRIDLASVQKSLYALRDRFVDKLLKIPGAKIVGNAQHGRGSTIANFIIEGAHPLDVATLLGYEGIAIRSGHHCAQVAMRDFGVEHSLRLSLGIYNRASDIDKAIAALHKVLKILRG